LVGGNYKGEGPEFNATKTKIGTDATVNASAIQQGDGGKVIFWGNETTSFDGTVYAQGGELWGDGGFVETSALQLKIGDNAKVVTKSPNGATGEWLLDPSVIRISNNADSSIENDGIVDSNRDVHSPDPAGDEQMYVSNLDVDTLEAWLVNSSVTIDATFGSSGNGSINPAFAPTNRILFQAGAETINWDSGNTLTLTAVNGIEIDGIATLTLEGNTVFNGPLVGNGNSLVVLASATFESSIASLGALTVGQSAIFKSDSIDITANTIAGGAAGGTLTLPGTQTVNVNGGSGNNFSGNFLINSGTSTLEFTGFAGAFTGDNSKSTININVDADTVYKSANQRFEVGDPFIFLPGQFTTITGSPNSTLNLLQLGPIDFIPNGSGGGSFFINGIEITVSGFGSISCDGCDISVPAAVDTNEQGIIQADNKITPTDQGSTSDYGGVVTPDELENLNDSGFSEVVEGSPANCGAA